VNLSLKFALIKNFSPAYQLASQVGINHNRLSRLATGFSSPKNEGKKSFARVLRKSIAELSSDEPPIG
jgi:hypothetical protein